MGWDGTVIYHIPWFSLDRLGKEFVSLFLGVGFLTVLSFVLSPPLFLGVSTLDMPTMNISPLKHKSATEVGPLSLILVHITL
jgi:hypothetical protein